MSEATELDSHLLVISYPGKDFPTAYQALVFSKWLRSLRFGNPLFAKVSGNDYYQNYHKYIQNLLNKPDTIVRFAVLNDNKDIVLGFSCSREDVLDYVHVHKDHRKQGLAKLLVPSNITTITHITKDALSILETNPHYKLIAKPEDHQEGRRSFKFNPFA